MGILKGQDGLVKSLNKSATPAGSILWHDGITFASFYYFCLYLSFPTPIGNPGVLLFFMRGFAPTRRGSFDKLRTGSFVSAKGPKTIGARAWPHGVPLPQSRLLGLPSTSGALRLTLRMNGLSLPVHASLPFVLSVALAKSKGAQTVLASNQVSGPGRSHARRRRDEDREGYG